MPIDYMISGESRDNFIGESGSVELWPVEPAFISSVYIVCNSQKQHIILVCVLADLLVLLLCLEHEP